MNDDKIIDKLFKYIMLKSKFKYIVFENTYGMTIEQYIQKNLENGAYWIDFETQNYKFLNPKENRKKIMFKDGYIIDICNWWCSGIGKLKKRLFDYDDNNEFLKKYYNFTGMDIEDKIVDMCFCKTYENGVFYNVHFIKCKFKEVFLFGSDKFNSNDYTDCNFTNVDFAVPFLNNSYFDKCKFNKCKDLHAKYNSLEGDEWKELVCKQIVVGFIENIFNECNFGFNSVDSLIFRNSFNLTNFSMGSFSDSSFYYNVFNECKFENIVFKNSGKKVVKCNSYDMSFRNKYTKCEFKNTDYTSAILLCNSFEENKYDNNTEFSMKYYDDFIKFYDSLSDKELEYMNREFEYMDKEEYIRSFMNLYHNLFKEYKNTVMTEKAYEYYYIYKCLEKDLSKLILKSHFSKNNLGKWFKRFVLYKTCGFGERPYRTLRLCIYIILICSFLYLFLGIDNSKEPILYLGIYHNLDSIFPNGYIIKNVTVWEFISDYFTSVYFSIISFATIGYGDYSPLTPLSKAVVCFQAIISVILVAVFTGTIVRKSFRD